MENLGSLILNLSIIIEILKNPVPGSLDKKGRRKCHLLTVSYVDASVKNNCDETGPTKA
jgi:hypothetical protein